MASTKSGCFWGLVIAGLWFHAGWGARETYGFLWNKYTGTVIASAHGTNSPYWLVAHINGHRTLAMIDSGASRISISRSQAKKLGVKPTGKVAVYGIANGTEILCDEGKVDLRMDGIHLKGVEAAVCESGSDYILIGQSALQQLKVTAYGEYAELEYRGGY